MYEISFNFNAPSNATGNEYPLPKYKAFDASLYSAAINLMESFNFKTSSESFKYVFISDYCLAHSKTMSFLSASAAPMFLSVSFITILLFFARISCLSPHRYRQNGPNWPAFRSFGGMAISPSLKMIGES